MRCQPCHHVSFFVPEYPPSFLPVVAKGDDCVVNDKDHASIMVLLLMTISNSFVVRPRIIHHSHENKTLKMISSQVPPSRPKSTSFMFLEWLLLHNFKAGKIVTSFLHDSPTCLCYTVVIPLDFHLMNSSSSLFDIFTGGCLGRPIQKSLLVHWHRTNTYQTLAHNIRAPKFCVFPKVG